MKITNIFLLILILALALFVGCEAKSCKKSPTEDPSAVSPAEKALITEGEKLLEKASKGLTKYEPSGDDDGTNTLTVTIDGEPYAPMQDDFGYRSIAELKQGLSKYFTDEYIDTTPLFTTDTTDEWAPPIYYKDYNGALYMWEGGDYFAEGSFYIWDSEMDFKQISRSDDTAIIEFCMYVRPMYSGNIWCTRHFTIEAGKISAVEHIKDDQPETNDFNGNWAGYDVDGKFVKGYSFSFDRNPEPYPPINGALVEYYADGTIVNHDNCEFEYRYSAFCIDTDDDWQTLSVETYSHNGFTEFTATEHDKDGKPERTLTYKRVNKISVADGKVVIE